MVSGARRGVKRGHSGPAGLIFVVLSSPDAPRGAHSGFWGSSSARLLLAALFFGTLAFLFGGALVAHIRLSANPAYFNDDVRNQVYPFLRYEDPAAFAGDYPGDYFLACRFPLAFQLLYTLAGKLHLVAFLSRALAYALLLVTLLGIGFVAFRLGGATAAWVAVALCLGSAVYLSCVVGGLPRAFAYPVVAGTMIALLRGSTRLLAVLAILGTALYPPAGALAAICLFLLLFFPIRADRGDAREWSLAKRIGILASVGLACAMLTLPMAVGARPYGPLITLSNASDFPEAGVGGRYHGNDRPPFHGFVRTAVRDLEDSMAGKGAPLVPSLRRWSAGGSPWRLRAILFGTLAISGIGWLRLAARRPEARRLLLLGVAGAGGYVLSRVGYPYFYLPQRFSLYPLPPLAAVLLATGVLGWIPEGRPRAWRGLVGAIPGILMLALLGAHGSSDEALTIVADPADPAYTFVRGLPPGALLAGWPSGMIDNVPWVSRRRSLVNFEIHQAQHVAFTLEMRKRASAVIEAFYSTDPGPLLRLRDEFGVTHFLVDLDLAAQRKASYFAPFDREIEGLRARSEGKELEILELLGPAGVYRDDRVAILDLSRVGAPKAD